MLGDANNDGSVNMKDILIMRKYIANYDIDLIELKDAENYPKSYIVLEYTDINSDKSINMKDVLYLRKHIAGIDVAYWELFLFIFWKTLDKFVLIWYIINSNSNDYY